MEEFVRKLEQKNTNFKYICYTLDLEEDHAGLLRDNYEGLDYLEDFIGVLEEEEMNLSIFIQAKIIEKYSEKLEILRKNNFDIHLHSYEHLLRKPKNPKDIYDDIEKSKSFLTLNPLFF